jgi:hypothetical protein
MFKIENAPELWEGKEFLEFDLPILALGGISKA